MDVAPEVERKFDVDESTVSPSFAGIAGLTRVQPAAPQALDAVYYDTAAHHLLARRITLRRRTGGTDPGWHLKLPAGSDARTEVRAPLGTDDAVPADLLDVVLAVVRDNPVAPVARIATTRTRQLIYGADDGLLAEFCDDQVTACTAADPTEQRWREWELELVTGDVDLLDRLSTRLLDAGAAPAAHGSKLARVLDAGSGVPTRPLDPVHRAVAEQVEALLVWDRAVRADADDAVHQMRVTIRKLRSLLQAGPGDDESIQDELRQLGGLLGGARDAEVLADRYREALDRFPPELVRGPVRARLVDGAVRRYRTGLRRSLTAMRSPRYFRLLDALEEWIAEPPGVAAAAPPLLDTAYRRVRRAAKAAARAAEHDRNEALHRIRKGAKRLRYTAAATNSPRVAERAKVVQTLLGDHQDSVVSRAHLIRQADAAHGAGEDTFTYGLLYQQEDELARNRRAQLDPALRKLAKAARAHRE